MVSKWCRISPIHSGETWGDIARHRDKHVGQKRRLEAVREETVRGNAEETTLVLIKFLGRRIRPNGYAFNKDPLKVFGGHSYDSPPFQVPDQKSSPNSMVIKQSLVPQAPILFCLAPPYFPPWFCLVGAQQGMRNGMTLRYAIQLLCLGIPRFIPFPIPYLSQHQETTGGT